MAQIGEIVIGINAKLDGLEKGAARSRNILREVSRGVREVSMLARGAGLSRIGSEATGFIDRIVSRVDELKKSAEETGISISQLSHGAIDDAEIAKLENMKSAFDNLQDSAKDFWITASGAEFVADVSDNLSALLFNLKKELHNLKVMAQGGKKESVWEGLFSGLVGGLSGSAARPNPETPLQYDNDRTTAEKERLTRLQKQTQEKNAKDRKKIEDDAKRQFEEKQRMLQQQQEKYDRARGLEDEVELAKFRGTGASDAEVDAFRERQKEFRRLEKMKEEAALAEKQRQDEERERQKGIEDANRLIQQLREEDAQKARELLDSLKTPQDRYIERLREIEWLEQQQNLTVEQAAKLRAKAMDETLADLEKDQKTPEYRAFGAQNRGSQEAFSTINRFRFNDQSQRKEEKDRKAMIKSLQEIAKNTGKEGGSQPRVVDF